eukprot:TRINITY_DN9146_c0_g1_i1.p1 TRINITY_DN9146_c0_g1~~TRINITY_DN9146_c0_g1_i1.p1  ORF type:complete len:570 (-),score=112.44 TRINITY_DN9146_c0_g1_i1:185-1834(-)
MARTFEEEWKKTEETSEFSISNIENCPRMNEICDHFEQQDFTIIACSDLNRIISVFFQDFNDVMFMCKFLVLLDDFEISVECKCSSDEKLADFISRFNLQGIVKSRDSHTEESPMKPPVSPAHAHIEIPSSPQPQQTMFMDYGMTPQPEIQKHLSYTQRPITNNHFFPQPPEDVQFQASSFTHRPNPNQFQGYNANDDMHFVPSRMLSSPPQIHAMEQPLPSINANRLPPLRSVSQTYRLPSQTQHHEWGYSSPLNNYSATHRPPIHPSSDHKIKKQHIVPKLRLDSLADTATMVSEDSVRTPSHGVRSSEIDDDVNYGDHSPSVIDEASPQKTLQTILEETMSQASAHEVNDKIDDLQDSKNNVIMVDSEYMTERDNYDQNQQYENEEVKQYYEGDQQINENIPLQPSNNNFEEYGQENAEESNEYYNEQYPAQNYGEFQPSNNNYEEYGQENVEESNEYYNEQYPTQNYGEYTSNQHYENYEEDQFFNQNSYGDQYSSIQNQANQVQHTESSPIIPPPSRLPPLRAIPQPPATQQTDDVSVYESFHR